MILCSRSRPPLRHQPLGTGECRHVDHAVSGERHHQSGAQAGPIVWQFMSVKVCDAEDFYAFLAVLPKQLNGQRLRQAVDA